MPRPDIGLTASAFAGFGPGFPQVPFEDLIEQVKSEYVRLQESSVALAVENRTLRSLLRERNLDSEVASSFGSTAATAPPATAGTTATTSASDVSLFLSGASASALQEPGSTDCWSSQGAVASPNVNPNSKGTAGGTLSMTAAMEEMQGSKQLEEMLGSKSLREGQVTRFCSNQSDSSIAKLESLAAKPSMISGLTEVSEDEEEDCRMGACLHKLRQMFELSPSKQTVNTEVVEEYLKRMGKATPEMTSALFDVFSRLLTDAASNWGRTTTTSIQRQKSAASAKSLRRSASAMQIPLESLASLLLEGNSVTEERLEPCSPEMKDLVDFLRVQTFQQDTMGILPPLLSLRELEKGVKEDRFEMRMEVFMNCVIGANALCLGIFVSPEPALSVWELSQMVDFFFTMIFLGEAFVKLQRRGIRAYFFGPSRCCNFFDIFIISLGISDLLMVAFMASSQSVNTSSFMVLKLLRLGRLVRVLRMSMFRELKLMINGIIGLLKTLGCVTVVLLMSIYAIGTVMVSLFGGGRGELITGQEQLFSSLPRSMFTVFRCLNLGDCTTSDGSPIALLMSEAAGWPFALVHCAFSVIMNYGLGSLITALVVDTTLNEAKKAEFRQSLKESHKKQISWSLHRLEQIFQEMQAANENTLTSPGRGDSQSMFFVGRSTFQAVLKRREAQQILDELDVDHADRDDLFEVLDTDGNGFIEVDELVKGLLRMGGKARRADTVATRLKIDRLVQTLTSTMARLHENQAFILERVLGNMERHPSSPSVESASEKQERRERREKQEKEKEEKEDKERQRR